MNYWENNKVNSKVTLPPSFIFSLWSWVQKPLTFLLSWNEFGLLSHAVCNPWVARFWLQHQTWYQNFLNGAVEDKVTSGDCKLNPIQYISNRMTGKIQKMPTIGEEAEHPELSYIADVSLSTCSHSGNRLIC